MFNKVLIVYKDGISDEDFNKLEKIQEMVDGEVNLIKGSNVNKNNSHGFDLVITFGGDGTFLSAGNVIQDAYIVGINSDPERSEGFLTSLNYGEMDKLQDILKGNYKVVEKHRAMVIINGEELDEHALNEVYVGTRDTFHTSRYILKYNGGEEEHRSAGIIISTGAGSTAWFLSAGGKPFNHDERKLSFVVREPYMGRRVYTPKILSGDLNEEESLIVKSTKDSGGVVSLGYSDYDFNQGDVVEVKLSDKPLRVLEWRAK